MKITLSAHEVEMAVQVGVRRQIEAMRAGLPDKHGYEGDGWSIHIEGAAGELAVAKALNRYWDGSVNTFKRRPDLPGKVQVRTRSGVGPRTDLIVRQDDSDDDVFFLVIGRVPHFDVAGWIRGRDAKQAKWSRTHGDRPAAYFVPRGELEVTP